ncbi:restriction endonuclease subunit S [Enterococcus faecium]|uniref:restriction endonuclease subunit S n=1 Tax=Enterococcus faecium TaxID=1352 RepID=UPI001E650F3D|nr:restriction endonuclease subunit S [Enterococcus faecium]MCD5220171.1 restriction endonuclease subunit S [Enterococcus faecium]
MSNDTRPEIRFPGFTDDWEQRKLGEIVQITMGQSPNSENYTENPEDYILVQGNADMKNNRVVPRVWTTQITKQAEKGDLILSVRAPVGDIGKTDYDVVLGRGVAAIKGNDFIFQQLGKMKESGYWNRFSTGSTFESINSNDIREALITIPTGEEQQKIGTFFKQLDDTIALQQRKLDLLKETKKGFLQKMFPKNGAKVPEIRFPGFTEDWEERKLGDITKISTGKLDANAMVENGKYDFYTSGIKKYRIDVAAFEGPSITIAGNGATVGYMHLADNKFNAYQRTYVLQEFLVDRSFIFSEIGNKLPKKIKQEARTGNIPYIVMDMLTELKLSIPQNNSEQQKIGNFFKQLDDTITLHQRKLDLLKEMKKGFLQKMFV